MSTNSERDILEDLWTLACNLRARTAFGQHEAELVERASEEIGRLREQLEAAQADNRRSRPDLWV